MNFANKVVLITGAGGGIGEGAALQFAKLGAKLSLIDINEENLKKATDGSKNVSETEVLALTADLTKDEDAKNVVDSTVEKFGRIDVLVNCAGIYGSANILDSNCLEVYDRMISSNLRSTVALTHYAAPELVKTKGCIVNISSISAVLVIPNMMAYSVAKAGMKHFTKCVALELASKGVRVNAILPGSVKTKLMVNYGMSQEESDTFWNKSIAIHPLKRLVDVSDVAEMIVFLASDKAASITGADFVIDSGLALGGLQYPSKMM